MRACSYVTYRDVCTVSSGVELLPCFALWSFLKVYASAGSGDHCLERLSGMSSPRVGSCCQHNCRAPWCQHSSVRQLEIWYRFQAQASSSFVRFVRASHWLRLAQAALRPSHDEDFQVQSRNVGEAQRHHRPLQISDHSKRARAPLAPAAHSRSLTSACRIPNHSSYTPNILPLPQVYRRIERV